jgi:hypothetical protein
MLQVGFVEHLAPVHLVMVARFVAFAVLVDEAALACTNSPARVVVAQFFAARVAQFGALRVVPDRLVGIAG